MLIHHSNLDYNVAASEAAKSARAKMEAMFAPGVRSAQDVLERVQTEVPVDAVVPSHRFEIEEDHDEKYGVTLGLPTVGRSLSLTRHSFGQLCSVAGLPQRYANDLLSIMDTRTKEPKRELWSVELLARNLRELVSHQRKKYLVRSVSDEARGILSDSYRRLDCRPLLDSFSLACQHVGAVPVDGHATDTKVEIKAMLPLIFEPIPNEVLCFGVAWANSDYGNGAHSLREFVLRLVCTNKAVADEMLRQIHLGKRIGEDAVFSQKTYQLDTETTASALYDVVGNAFSPEKINAYQARVRKAHEEQVDGKTVAARLGRLDLTKEEAKGVQEAFESSDVVMLPPGNTNWRLSNAISWFAGTRVDDEERKMELERVAGKVLPSVE